MENKGKRIEQLKQELYELKCKSLRWAEFLSKGPLGYNYRSADWAKRFEECGCRYE